MSRKPPRSPKSKPPQPAQPEQRHDKQLDELDEEVFSPQTIEALSDLEPGSADEPSQRIFVVKRDVDKRLDVYLQQRLKGLSRSRVQQLIELGGVLLNGQPPKASTAVKQNDRIRVMLPAKAVRSILPEPIPIAVMYEDDDLIIVNKQANLIVHPARSHLSGTLVNGLAWRFKEQREQQGLGFTPRTTRGFREQRGGDPASVEGLSNVGSDAFRPGIVHRLDKNTTGLLVVAKQDQTHWAIARQFEQRTVLKAYLAVVHGNFSTVGGAIDEPIGKHPTIREAFCVRHDSAGKNSVTLYRVREQYRGYSLVELELKTGRTHQIRVHLSYLGHPIVGDIIYGGEPVGYPELDAPPIAAGSRQFLNFARDKAEGQRVEAQAAGRDDVLIAHPSLHAAVLGFEHPRTQQHIRFTAPLHEPMATLVRELRQRPLPNAPVVTEGYWVDLDALVG